MAARIYEETFDDGPGGWGGWISNSAGPKALEYRDRAVISRSPWWVDYNHAPPGGGYLHMVLCLNTYGAQGEHQQETAGRNRYIDGGFPIDFTGARINVHLRGELEPMGAQLVLLIQGHCDGLVVPWALTGQPLAVSEEWREQTITLTPDPSQWTPLGSRYNRTDMYGHGPLEKVLAHVSSNIMFILFPLDVVPMGPLEGDPHILRPEKDYPVWRHRLPEGYVALDRVRIEFSR